MPKLPLFRRTVTPPPVSEQDVAWLVSHHGLDSSGQRAVRLVAQNPPLFPELHRLLESKLRERPEVLDSKRRERRLVKHGAWALGAGSTLLQLNTRAFYLHQNARRWSTYVSLPLLLAGRLADIAATRRGLDTYRLFHRRLLQEHAHHFPPGALAAFLSHPETYESNPFVTPAELSASGRSAFKIALRDTANISLISAAVLPPYFSPLANSVLGLESARAAWNNRQFARRFILAYPSLQRELSELRRQLGTSNP